MNEAGKSAGRSIVCHAQIIRLEINACHKARRLGYCHVKRPSPQPISSTRLP